jgi:hypothetical protein
MMPSLHTFIVAARLSWRRYLFRVPRQNFFGAENAVVGNVGVALITVRLIGRAALVAHPLVPSTLAPAARARPVPPTPTKTATPATLSWLPWSGWLRMLVRAGSEIVSEDRLGNDEADRHEDGARCTVVVIGSGMVLVIMAVDISEGWRGSSPG